MNVITTGNKLKEAGSVIQESGNKLKEDEINLKNLGEGMIFVETFREPLIKSELFMGYTGT